VCGKLTHACNIVWMGPLHIRPLRERLPQMPVHYKLTLRSAGVKAALEWWIAKLETLEQIPFAWVTKNKVQRQLASPNEVVHTDAATGTGIGGFWGTRWLQFHWSQVPYWQHGWTINFEEIFVVAVAAYSWGHLWSGKHVKFVSDNLGTVWQLNVRDARNKMQQAALLILEAAAEKFRFFYTSRFLEGDKNELANYLSRVFPAVVDTYSKYGVFGIHTGKLPPTLPTLTGGRVTSS